MEKSKELPSSSASACCSAETTTVKGRESKPEFQLCGGVREDCIRLAGLVRKKPNMRALLNGWKEMQFQRALPLGRNLTEKIEYVEESLVIARDLWLDAGDIREQASFFLVMAAMYTRQPFRRPSYPIRIRLVADHVVKAKEFVVACDVENLHDCVIMFDVLFTENAFDFHAYPRDYGMEKPLTAYLQRDNFRRKPKKSLPLHELPMMKDLGVALADYCETKRRIKKAPSVVCADRLNSVLEPREESKDDDDSDLESTSASAEPGQLQKEAAVDKFWAENVVAKMIIRKKRKGKKKKLA